MYTKSVDRIEQISPVLGQFGERRVRPARQATESTAQDMYGQARDAVSDTARHAASSFEQLLRRTVETSSVHSCLYRARHRLAFGPNPSATYDVFHFGRPRSRGIDVVRLPHEASRQSKNMVNRESVYGSLLLTRRPRRPSPRPTLMGGTGTHIAGFTIMFRDSLRHSLTRTGELTAHPAAFGVVVAYAIAWLIFSPTTFGWGAIATLATWAMTLFITRTEHRDTQAIHAKIDELLRAHGEAKTELTRLDQQDVEEIVAHRSEARRQLKS